MAPTEFYTAELDRVLLHYVTYEVHPDTVDVKTHVMEYIQNKVRELYSIWKSTEWSKKEEVQKWRHQQAEESGLWGYQFEQTVTEACSRENEMYEATRLKVRQQLLDQGSAVFEGWALEYDAILQDHVFLKGVGQQSRASVLCSGKMFRSSRRPPSSHAANNQTDSNNVCS